MRNLFICMLLICAPSVYSQTSNDSTKKIWATVGIGDYRSGRSEGFGFNISADYLKNNNYWKLRYIYTTEYLLLFNIIGLGPRPREKFNDIGILYGWVTKSKIFRFSIAGGIGILTGTERGALLEAGTFTTHWYNIYEENHIFSPAIPLEVELSLIPFRNLGIGVSGFANLNFENSMVGFTIKIEIGRIR